MAYGTSFVGTIIENLQIQVITSSWHFVDFFFYRK